MYFYRSNYFTGLDDTLCLNNAEEARKSYTVFVFEINSKRVWCSDVHYYTLNGLDNFKQLCLNKLIQYE